MFNVDIKQQHNNLLTLFHSERLKLYTILAFLSAIGLHGPEALHFAFIGSVNLEHKGQLIRYCKNVFLQWLISCPLCSKLMLPLINSIKVTRILSEEANLLFRFSSE